MHTANNRSHLLRFTSVLLAAATVGAITFMPSVSEAADAPTKVAIKFDGTTKKLSGFPATLKGGLTTITLTGGSYGVNLQLVKMTGTHSDAEIEKNINSDDPPPSWASFPGGTGSNKGAGLVRSVTVNLGKGSYFWTLFSNGEELNGKSPWGRFTVSGANSGTQPSGGTSTIKMLDYGFDATGLKVGKNLINYTNAGKEVHHAVMFKLKAGKTLADLQKFLASNGPPPAGLLEEDGNTGLPLLSAGLTQVADIELTKGTYGFVCFMPDKTGKPHMMSGMVKEIKIA
jgi:hypothetical protein